MKNCLSIIDNKNPAILLAPNAFKGSLKAEEFCRIVTEELTSTDIPVISCPMCDGGDGTAAILAFYLKAHPQTYDTVDALGRPHRITYYTNQDTAIVDLAEICGLKDLHPNEYDVMNCRTNGLGQTLLHIRRNGFRKIILGLGGSASIDAGIGALCEMGMKIVKSSNNFKNNLIEISNLDYIDLKDNFNDTEWYILCDVNNPLCGTLGAAPVFGPQKGASPSQITLLDNCLLQYSHLLTNVTSVQTASLEKAGAAGGVAASFHALLGARLISGTDYCMQISGFFRHLSHASCVITGEGRLDEQSFHGKIPGSIARLCQHYNTPLFVIAGSIQPPLPMHLHTYSLVNYANNISEAIHNPQPYLRLAVRDLQRDLLKLI